MFPNALNVAPAALLAALAIGGAQAASSSPSVEPCAVVSQQFQKQTATSNASEALLPAQTVVDCLHSLPFNASLADQFIFEFSKYVQWQSTLEILTNPPPDYLAPSTDIFGGLSTIRGKIAAKGYKSQFDFDLDVFELVSSANDGHFTLSPCSLAIFQFETTQNLVSLSSDGVQVPQLYTLDDALLLAAGSKKVSPITLINGVGASSVVENLARLQGFQDVDARYNSLLGNVPINGQGQATVGAFPFGTIYPGVNEFNFTFTNGTQAEIPVLAVVSASAANFTSGEALFNASCLPQKASTASQPAATPLAVPKTYPTPIVRDGFNTIVGYFPTDSLLTDVAVLSVPTFSTMGAGPSGVLPDTSIADFANEAQLFINRATAAGKKKIVVDVTGNGGGVVDSGFALLSIFFPNMTIFSATRFRSHPEISFIGKIFNAVNVSAIPSPDDQGTVASSGFVVADQLQPDQVTGFKSVEDLFGPFDVRGVPSSNIVAEDNFRTAADPKNDPINTFGLGGQLNGTAPPFAVEDIIIITDGQCSSTCTIFVNHMVGRGVRVVSFGGRPQAGPMQSIGGTKGSQYLPLEDVAAIVDVAQRLAVNATRERHPILSSREMFDFMELSPLPLEGFPLPLTSAGVNFRNAFAPGNDLLPTQFIFEAAECHLFYTADSLVAPEKYWASAANAIWGTGNCAYRASAPTVPSPDTTLGGKEPNTTNTSTPSTSSAASGSHMALGLLLALSQGMQ